MYLLPQDSKSCPKQWILWAGQDNRCSGIRLQRGLLTHDCRPAGWHRAVFGRDRIPEQGVNWDQRGFCDVGSGEAPGSTDCLYSDLKTNTIHLGPSLQPDCDFLKHTAGGVARGSEWE